MTLVCLRDKKVIESFLRNDPYLHIYGIGDLDDFFWPYTTWYGSTSSEELDAVVLLYERQPPPVILALSKHIPVMRGFLESILHLLPERFYAHLSPGVEDALKSACTLDPHGMHYKMALRDSMPVHRADCSRVIPLTMSDLGDILKLYGASYPGNWFDPEMLETDRYFGIREGEDLVSVAGVHVYSEKYRVAALGNIATHPDHRKKGFGAQVTAALCRSLLDNVDHIGLNVRFDNRAAISCYGKLGFQVIASYNEFMVETNR